MKELQEIKLKSIPILKKNGVTKAGIFGSFARGEQKKKSDIDFLVKVRDEASLTDLIGLKLELQKALNKKIDLVEYEVIRPELKEKILNDEIIIL
jgi:predicted nucleotidyltransferase